MTNRIVWPAIAGVIVLALFPSTSPAQAPATTFDELRHALHPGDHVIVTSADKRRTRASVVAVSDTSLAVRARPVFRFGPLGPLTIHTESSVAEVTRIDSLANGAIVGLGVGAGLGISACASQAEPAPCGQLLYLPVVFTALVGMLTGTVVDAAIRKTLYRGGAPRAGRASVTLAPLIDTRTTGASLNVRF